MYVRIKMMWAQSRVLLLQVVDASAS
jgi:hypothetical protein